MHSNPQEELQQEDMQTVVHQMSTCKTSTLLQRRFTMERELARQIQVAEPTQYVSDCIGDTGIDPMVKNKIDDVMDDSRCYTNNKEPCELPFLVVLMQKGFNPLYIAFNEVGHNYQ